MGAKLHPIEEVHRVPEDLLLQQGVPGGALEEGAQEALQILLRKDRPGRQG